MSDEPEYVTWSDEPGFSFHLHTARLKEQLAKHGLALVPAADVLKPEERAVLEAVAAIPGSELRSRGNWYGYAKKVGDAEAARRAAKEANGG